MTYEDNLAQKHSVAVIILALIILILVVYWPVQSYDEFVSYDDTLYTTRNFQIQQGFNFKSIAYCFTDVHTGHWNPLTMISHMLDWQLFGKMAGGHHWTSVIIHIFNAILLFLFLKISTGAIWRSAFVAALFALHPINVESVAWIAERKNVLSTFFWILTILFYIWYVKSPGWKRYLPMIFCFVLGLMSKAMLVTLPFVLLLLDYWPLNRTKIKQQENDQTTDTTIAAQKEKISFLILEKVPLFVLSAISICITFYAADSVKTISTLEALPLSKRMANAIFSYGLYIKKMFWPVDLAVFYPFNENIPLWHVFLAILFIVVITILVCVYFRKLPYLPVGWFWYLGTLVPVIGIMQVGVQAMADRYAYVPFIGLFIIISWRMFGVLEKLVPIKMMTMIAVGALFVLMVFTHFQVKHWENNYTLYQQAIRVTTENSLPHKNLGLYLIEKNRPKEALDHFYKAISLKEGDATLHNSLGVTLAMLGKNREAIEQYEIALRLDPNHALIQNNLGVVLIRLGRDNEAEKHFREAIRLGLEYHLTHYYLAGILKKKGFYQEAAYHYQEARRIRVNNKYVGE